ncbi:MAG: ribonuclease HI [Anaerolineae bacterium]|nr:ribonuclease HI [Anaerolineae bacterium]
MAQASTQARSPSTQVLIYTDGGCDPNPGPGGWGAVLLWGHHRQELSGGEPDTTNNRMELRAAIEALKQLKRPCKVTIVTDSTYLRNGITRWLDAWKRRDWHKANGAPVQNADLWQELDRQASRHQIHWQWTRGHAGDPLNERADELARHGRYKALGHNDDNAPMPDLEEVAIYTRASVLGSPGPAGYAAAIVRAGKRPQVVAGSWPSATINAAELYAAIKGLQQLRTRSRVRIHTASSYVLHGATRWLAQWERNGWRTSKGTPVEHRHLWEELSRVMGDHDVRWEAMDAGDAHPLSMQALKRARQAAKARQRENQGEDSP